MKSAERSLSPLPSRLESIPERKTNAPTIREALEWLESQGSVRNTASPELFREALPVESARISTDQGKVFRKRNEIAKGKNTEQKEFAILAEYIIGYYIAHLKCLGDVTVRRGSDYDEMFNGADLVIEWNDTTMAPLVLDITLADEGSSVAQEKQRRQEEKIDRRGSTLLSYFQDNNNDYFLDVKAAHAVVFVSKKTIQAFAERYVTLMKSKERLMAMISRYESHENEDDQLLLKNTRAVLEKNAANLQAFLDASPIQEELPNILLRQLNAHVMRAQKTLEREQAEKRTSVEREYPQLIEVRDKLAALVKATTHRDLPKAA
ncbi:hypothetical protein HY620_00325 [Candidatus Uhrbacteria bacterium]|nr:hypothetical protein [Candidatus Uhrbacteria bacterium]